MKTSSPLTPQPISLETGVASDCDVLVVGAGFEERASRFLFESIFPAHAICILVHFDRSIEGNKETESYYFEEAKRKFGPEKIVSVGLTLHDARPFDKEVTKALTSIPRSHRKIVIDISGLPTHAICSMLRLTRQFRPLEIQSVIYTAAKEYVPTEAEYEELKEKQPKEINFLKRSMALEMSQNYIPDSFSGHRTNEGKTALAVFAGYEVHRSAGVIDNINPSVLLLLYGRPGASDLAWRLDLSKQLHAPFERLRRCAFEVVSTLDVSEALDMLEQYYKWLFDDYDLTIAPVCSKMHAVATFLFWERYKEVQLAFPLPVGYNPGNRPLGIGQTYKLDLPPSRLLHSALRPQAISS